MKRGRTKGREGGRKKGRKKGREGGREEGRKEGRMYSLELENSRTTSIKDKKENLIRERGKRFWMN